MRICGDVSSLAFSAAQRLGRSRCVLSSRLGQWGTALEARLFADSGTKQGYRRQVEPDWASIHRELKRKHVTLSILWDEYVERNPEVMDPCVFGAKGRRSSD